MLIKNQRSHSVPSRNFHIKKQFYSFNFFSIISSSSNLLKFFFVCLSVDFKNVLIKAEIEKTEIKLILLFWDFIICFFFVTSSLCVFFFREGMIKSKTKSEILVRLTQIAVTDGGKKTWDRRRRQKNHKHQRAESRLRSLEVSFCQFAIAQTKLQNEN